MRHSTIKIGVVVGLGLGLTLILLGSIGGWPHRPSAAQAGRLRSVASTIRYVEPGGTDESDCSAPDKACGTVQFAVNRAVDGDEIRVAAGRYTDLNTSLLPGMQTITHVARIHQNVTIGGGYTPANWTVSDPLANPTILDAQGRGRVLYIDGDLDVTVEGLGITGGDAAGLRGVPLGEEDAGGGVYATVNRITIGDCQVFSNAAGYGGGLYLGCDAATLSGNTVTSNTAQQGGGLYIDRGESTFSENVVAANVANYGGGLFVSNSAATIGENEIRSNQAITAGGGLLLWRSEYAVMAGNTVISNTARRGGGLYLDESGSGIVGNVFVANVASEGGGLCLDESAAILANNVVAENRADVAGSGLYILASSPLMQHSTIARNDSTEITADGGGGSAIHVTNNEETVSDVDLVNTILVGHDVGITVTVNNRAALASTLWGTGTWANATDWGGAGTIVTGTSNYWDHPDFVAPDAGDYHIGITSAALDKGPYTGVSDDIDGEPRPQGRGYDLGADETGLALTKQAVPQVVRPGGQVHYTIRVTNTSVVSLTAAITDILPDHVTSAGIRTWRPVTVAPGAVHEQLLVVTVETGYMGPLTNVVEVTTDQGASGVFVETSWAGYRVYLPLALRNA